MALIVLGRRQGANVSAANISICGLTTVLEQGATEVVVDVVSQAVLWRSTDMDAMLTTTTNRIYTFGVEKHLNSATLFLSLKCRCRFCPLSIALLLLRAIANRGRK